MKIRSAKISDTAAIAAVHKAAFESDAEARLFAMLADDGDICLSLVAEEGGRIVASNILSAESVTGDGAAITAWAVGPIGVLPELQKLGVGSALMEEAIALARAQNIQMLFLLGDPKYYSRFGFSAETAAPFASPYAGPYFQALLLDADLGLPKTGKADYAPAFARLE